MAETREVEKIHIRRGILDKEGNRQDVIAGKGIDKAIHLNAASGFKPVEWRWRLVEGGPDEATLEQRYREQEKKIERFLAERLRRQQQR